MLVVHGSDLPALQMKLSFKSLSEMSPGNEYDLISSKIYIESLFKVRNNVFISE